MPSLARPTQREAYFDFQCSAEDIKFGGTMYEPSPRAERHGGKQEAAPSVPETISRFGLSLFGEVDISTKDRQRIRIESARRDGSFPLKRKPTQPLPLTSSIIW